MFNKGDYEKIFRLFVYLFMYIYIFLTTFLFWIINPSFRRWEHEKFLATSISSPSPPSFVLYSFYIVQIYNIHSVLKPSLLWLFSISSTCEWIQWLSTVLLAWFHYACIILWIFRLLSFGCQAVLSNKCSWIFCFPEPLHLNCTWGHPLFSQNSALPSSTMNIMKSDSSLIFFYPL